MKKCNRSNSNKNCVMVVDCKYVTIWTSYRLQPLIYTIHTLTHHEMIFLLYNSQQCFCNDCCETVIHHSILTYAVLHGYDWCAFGSFDVPTFMKTAMLGVKITWFDIDHQIQKFCINWMGKRIHSITMPKYQLSLVTLCTVILSLKWTFLT